MCLHRAIPYEEVLITMYAVERRHSVTAVIAVALALSILGIGVAYARYIASYDLIVPRLGGTAFTNPLTKVNYSRGVDNNKTVGGDYKVYSAIYRNTTRVTDKKLISDGDRVLHSYYSGQNQPGTGYRLGHTNQLLTPVRVQTTGTWSPDEY